MKKWLIRFLKFVAHPTFASHAAEAMREIGVLWLVFAMLDKLIAEQLTFAWVVKHGSAAVAMWAFGIYIELMNERRDA